MTGQPAHVEHRTPVAEWITGGGWSVHPRDGASELQLDPLSTSQTEGMVVPGSLSWLRSSQGAHRVRVGLRLDPGERLIGFGERYDRLDQRGSHLDVRVFEPYKRQWGSTRTFLPIPFFISSHGWGVWVATSRRVWFDPGSTEPDRMWIEADLDPADPPVRLVLYIGNPNRSSPTFSNRPALPSPRPPGCSDPG